MKYCGSIKKGDTVLLIAPSSPLRDEGAAENCEIVIRELGYNTVIGDSVNSFTNKGYAAAPEEVRVKDIHRGFSDPEIDAIWCVRGGSMAMELLPYLNAELIARNPKPLIGFSDVTALHMFLQEKCGMTSYHAPCVSGMIAKGPDDYAMHTFEAVMNMEQEIAFENYEGRALDIIKAGCAEGTIVGGNLTLVASLTGTDYALNTNGKILFLEDVEEDVYRVNRMLLQLKLAGKFDNVAGVLFGAFTDCPNGYNSEYGTDELLREFFKDAEFPVYSGMSVGHIRKNATLPLGLNCRMQNGAVTFFK